MASTTCWNCEQLAHMTPVDGSGTKITGGFRDCVMACFSCDGCGALNIGIGKGWPGSKDLLTWLTNKQTIDWQPQPAAADPEWDFPDVPTDIADAAAEAYACCELADAYRAAVIMARAVIEATAKDKGIKKGSLLNKIDAMSDLIRPHVREGAHEVRLLGNDMAHGDLAADVTAEDAELVLTLMSEVLNDVYQSPARVKRAQAAREAKKQQQSRIAAIRDGKIDPAMILANAYKPTGQQVVGLSPIEPATTSASANGMNVSDSPDIEPTTSSES